MGGERVRVKAKFMAHFRDEKEEQRRKNPIMTEIIEKVEKEELQQELKVIVDKLDSIPHKVQNGFLKKTDINNFDNYRTMILSLKQRKLDPSDKLSLIRGQTPSTIANETMR